MRIIMTTILLALLATTAHAQTALAVSPTAIQFDSSDQNTIDGGNPVVATYRIELWAPGTDTTVGQPLLFSPDIVKTTAALVTGTTEVYQIPLALWGFTVPQGPTYVATILTKGPGGSARSTVSNPFNFPVPTRAPRAVTGVQAISSGALPPK